MDKDYSDQRQIAMTILTETLIKYGDVEEIVKDYDSLVEVQKVNPIAAARLVRIAREGTSFSTVNNLFSQMEARCYSPPEKSRD